MDNPWINLSDKMPPNFIWVETKGGNLDQEEIVKDYFHGDIGDWIYNNGDPTHWRKIKENNT